MNIYLAGLHPSHIKHMAPYAMAARMHGTILVTIFDYLDTNPHACQSTNIHPPKEDHERQDNNES